MDDDDDCDVSVYNRSLSVRVLAELGRYREGPPVATPDLVALCAAGLSHPRSRVWEVLRRLLREGLVSREVRSGDRRTFWRLA